MADEPQDAPAAETKPAPRRRGPNKPRPDGAPKPGRKPRVAKSVVETATAAIGKAEEAVVETAAKPAAAVGGVAKSVVKAVKPRAAKRTTPPPAKSKGRGTSKPKTSGKGWGSLTIAGGLAAAGAVATAAVFALRGSSTTKPAPKPSTPPNEKGKAIPVGGDTTIPVMAGGGEEAGTPKEA